MKQYAIFEAFFTSNYFWYLQIHFDGLWSSEGQTHLSFPLAVLAMCYVVLSHRENDQIISIIANHIGKRRQLACYQAFISANCTADGVC